MEPMKYIIYSKETRKPVYISGRNIVFDYLQAACLYISVSQFPDLYLVARNFRLDSTYTFLGEMI